MKKTWQINWYKELISTNETAQEAMQRCDNMSVIAAFEQTSGRGQGNHQWHSMSGENLTFSIVLKYRHGAFDARKEKLVSDHTASSLIKYLQTKGITAWMKLPNDIYVSDKKICGILIRHKVMAGKLCGSIIGIGLNVNQKEFPSFLPNPVSMSMLTGLGYDIQKELEAFLEIFSENLEELSVEL